MEEIEKVLKKRRKYIIEEQIEVHLEEQIKEEASTHSMPTETDFSKYSDTERQEDDKLVLGKKLKNNVLM